MPPAPGDLADALFPKQPFGPVSGAPALVASGWRLAYCLHPQRYVARGVLRQAAATLPTIVLPRQHNRPEALHPYRAQLTLGELFQVSIFEVSEAVEKDQEGPSPQPTPRYRPSASVLLIRFIKHLVWSTMVRQDSYPVAVALGCCLFTYSPLQVCSVANLLRDQRLWNLRRLKRQVHHQLKARFTHIGRFHGRRLQTQPPTAGEREVVHQALQVCTPWGTACFAPDTPVIEHLIEALPERHIEGLPERQRKHALICPTCAGLAQLVRQWNAMQAPAERLADPTTMLEVPMWNWPSFTPDDADPFDPPMSDDELEELRQGLVDALLASQQRRRQPAFQRFRVCVDGEEQGQWTGEAPVSLSLRIPVSALRVQVFGQDAEGEVPLGVFYLPDLAAHAPPQHLYQVTESGATLALTVWPGSAVGGTRTARQVRVQFWAEEALVPKTVAWYETAVTAAWRSLELAQLTGDTTLATDLQARLTRLQQAWAAAEQPEAPGPASREKAPARAHAHRGQDLVVRWLSPLWQPLWAGAVISATGSTPPTQVFRLDDGEIRLTCRWSVAAQGTTATLHVSWRADLRTPSDLWVRFLQPETTTLLAEVRLGTTLVGEKILTSQQLGFDPSRDRWALVVLLREVPT